MFAIGTKVVITLDDVFGTVCGHGFYQLDQYATMSPAYIISLDKGFWNEDHSVFTTCIVAHPDNVMEVE